MAIDSFASSTAPAYPQSLISGNVPGLRRTGVVETGLPELLPAETLCATLRCRQLRSAQCQSVWEGHKGSSSSTNLLTGRPYPDFTKAARAVCVRCPQRLLIIGLPNTRGYYKAALYSALAPWQKKRRLRTACIHHAHQDGGKGRILEGGLHRWNVLLAPRFQDRRPRMAGHCRSDEAPVGMHEEVDTTFGKCRQVLGGSPQPYTCSHNLGVAVVDRAPHGAEGSGNSVSLHG